MLIRASLFPVLFCTVLMIAIDRRIFNMTIGDLFKKWKLENSSLIVGFASVEFAPTEEDQAATWDMYVKLVTRTATQPFLPNTGDEKKALEYVYLLFETTRNILKEKGRKAEQFTKIVIIVLNQVVRPFTAK
jgi:hypothetical protein